MTIDVEGQGWQVLIGAKAPTEKWRPVLFLEFFPENYREWKFNHLILLGFLDEFGYVYSIMENSGRATWESFKALKELTNALAAAGVSYADVLARVKGWRSGVPEHQNVRFRHCDATSDKLKLPQGYLRTRSPY